MTPAGKSKFCEFRKNFNFTGPTYCWASIIIYSQTNQAQYGTVKTVGN